MPPATPLVAFLRRAALYGCACGPSSLPSLSSPKPRSRPPPSPGLINIVRTVTHILPGYHGTASPGQSPPRGALRNPENRRREAPHGHGFGQTSFTWCEVCTHVAWPKPVSQEMSGMRKKPHQSARVLGLVNLLLFGKSIVCLEPGFGALWTSTSSGVCDSAAAARISPTAPLLLAHLWAAT